MVNLLMSTVILLLVLSIGLVMLISPVSCVRFNAWLNRGQIAEKMRWNDPEEMRRSFSMRLQTRLAGVIVIFISLVQAYDAIFGVPPPEVRNSAEADHGGGNRGLAVFFGLWLIFAVGLMASPSRTFRLIRWTNADSTPLTTRDVRSLRILGGLAFAFGVWSLKLIW